MRHPITLLRRRAGVVVASAAATAILLSFATPAADAAARTRCDGTHGRELAHSKIVKVYKVKTGSSFRFYGCAKPRGPVYPLTRSFKGTQVKLVAAKAAYVAFTRTISGENTVSVVDARTGRQEHGLYPPDVKFDADPETPQIGAVRLNDRAEVAISYIGLGAGDSTDSTTYVYAYDESYDRQLLDSAPSEQIPPKSLKVDGDTVSWTHGGVTRTAKLGAYSLSVLSSGNAQTGAGDVTTSPEGIACHLGAMAVLSGNCVGSFAPDSVVTVVATGGPASTVTISGGCSAVHAPQAGQTTSVATCNVTMGRAQTVKVTFT